MTCLLCLGVSREEGRVSAVDLVWLYRSRLGLDVSGSLKGLDCLTLHRCAACGLYQFSPPVIPGPDFYRSLHSRPWYHQADRIEFDRAAAYTAGRRVLDVGSGIGAARTRLRAAQYVGLETNEAAVKAAALTGVDVRLQTVRVHAIEKPREYEAVCAFQVLEHIADPRTFLGDCLMTLRNGGFLILSVPAYDSFVSALPNNPLNLPPHHLTWWPDSALRMVAKVWDLELTAMVSETVEPVHRRWYAADLCRKTLCAACGLSPRPILDRRLRYRAAEAAGWRMGWFLAKGMIDDRMLPRGHTVTAVYRKRDG